MAGPIYDSSVKLSSGRAAGVLIPTAVQTSSDFLDYWSSLTCLYDPMWVPDDRRATLPVVFFHITGIRESGSTEVSKKRVILYEPQATDTANELAKVVRPSVLRSVADNAVRDPRVYNISAVLPFKPFGRYEKDGINIMFNTLSILASIVGWDDNAVVNGWGSAMAYANQVTALLGNVANSIEKLPSLNGVAYMNKNSLDAMWEASHFLCMKMWTGYEYKYVMITNVEVEKKGTEDDVFRLNLQVQETQVLTATRPAGRGGKLKGSLAKTILFATERALAQALEGVTGVYSEVKANTGK